MPSANYSNLLKDLTKLDAFVEVAPGEKGMAVFYSGADDAGKNNKQAADECTQVNSKAYTIEQTPAGKFMLDKVENAYELKQISKAEYRELWNTASQMFAAEAEGPAIGFLKNTADKSTFATKEVTLFADGNSKMTHLNGVTPDLINQAGANNLSDPSKLQNTLQMLGDRSDPSNCFDPPGGSGATITTSSILKGAATVAKLEAHSLVPHVPQSQNPNQGGTHINYGMVAAGAGLAAVSLVFPPGEIVAGTLIGAGLGIGAAGAAGVTLQNGMPGQSMNDNKSDPNSVAYNDLSKNSSLASAVAQLKNSGASLQDVGAANAANNAAAPYVYEQSANLSKTAGAALA